MSTPPESDGGVTTPDTPAGAARHGDPGGAGPDGASEDGIDHRAGFCALVGLPNVGKSTLLNRLVGADLAIVTHKAQTTRRRLRGIYSDDHHQAVFVDTPGLLEPRYLLQEAMRSEAERALEGTDVRVWVVDAGHPRSLEFARSSALPERDADVLCVNKLDRVAEGRREELLSGLEEAGWSTVVGTVAEDGTGVDRLRREVLDRLPVSPALYPPDQLATASLRDFAAEFVREACFRELEEEVPYSIAVVVEEFRESEDPVYISAVLHVERPSQKGIVIGEGGRMIRAIGTRARGRIETLLDRRVYLDLWVKVLPKWRKKRSELARLGFEVRPREGG